MYKLGKSLLITGLFISAAQAIEGQKVKVAKQATENIITTCSKTLVSVPSAVINTGSSLITGSVKCLHRGIDATTIKNGGLQYWTTVLPRVAVAAAITFLVVKGATALYNDTFGCKTKSIIVEEDTPLYSLDTL